MPIPFAEVRFPSDISYGSSGGPGFSTTVYPTISGSEQRNVNWQSARCRYDVSHGIRDKADMDDLIDFFYQMRGRATGFRFKDWSDYQLVQEAIGTGNGTQTVFPITKTYGSGATLYTREIKKIVTPSVGPPVIPFIVRVNAVVADPTTYAINYNTGVITFTAPVTNGHVVDVTCEFDVPVRFDTDEMNVTLEAFQLETWNSIPIVEIKV